MYIVCLFALLKFKDSFISSEEKPPRQTSCTSQQLPGGREGRRGDLKIKQQATLFGLPTWKSTIG